MDFEKIRNLSDDELKSEQVKAAEQLFYFRPKLALPSFRIGPTRAIEGKAQGSGRVPRSRPLHGIEARIIQERSVLRLGLRLGEQRGCHGAQGKLTTGHSVRHRLT